MLTIKNRINISKAIALTLILGALLKYGMPNFFKADCTSALRTYLQSQEQKAWDALSAYNIDRKNCETIYAQHQNTPRPKKMKHDKRIPKDVQLVIREVMHDFGIQSDCLHMRIWNDFSAAGVQEDTLFINVKKFKELGRNEQKFVIGHELQHFRHHDSEMRGLLYDMIGQSNINFKDKNDPINIYERFHEERADIETALKNEQYAQGYVQFMQTLMKQGDNPGISHPKHSKRLQFAQAILHKKDVDFLSQGTMHVC